MSSTPGSQDDNVNIGDGFHTIGLYQIQKASTSRSNDENEQKNETDETNKSTADLAKETTKPSASTSGEASPSVSPTNKSDKESEEIKITPSKSNDSIESSQSPKPQATGSADVQPTTGRILLKRRRSRISVPIVIEPRNVIEEVDSAPRPSKRRTPKKKMVALFLESDYPRRK